MPELLPYAPGSPSPLDVCDRCGFPAVELSDGRWVHAEAADAVFCQLVMQTGVPTDLELGEVRDA